MNMNLQIEEVTVSSIRLVEDHDVDTICRWYVVCLAQEDPVTCMTIEVTVVYDEAKEHLKQFLKSCCGLEDFESSIAVYNNQTGRIDGMDHIRY